MKPISVIKFLIFSLILSYLALSPLRIVHAQTNQPFDPYKGKYELIVPPQPTDSEDKVEVVELFWYRCPHCYSFEKRFLEGWLEKKPEHVEFVKMPAVFNSDRWIPLARAYYTAKALGVVDKIHTPLFKAIHVDKRRINDKKTLQEFFAGYGVSKEDFTETYNSTYVDTKIKRAQNMTARYGINGVPAVIVNGKYRLSSELTDGYANLLKVMDFLIAKEQVIMQAKQAAKQAKKAETGKEEKEKEEEKQP